MTTKRCEVFEGDITTLAVDKVLAESPASSG